jgi:DNA polymerase-4
MNKELERIASQYAPVYENDRAGNLYLDITGTSRIFGPPADCASRILHDLIEKTKIKPAAASACNKLVSKVATRAIRPSGLIQINSGTEDEFLAHQDIRILPGMGPTLLRTAETTGIREIGELASLTVKEALSIFGKNGPLLRSMAQGIDGTPIEDRNRERKITEQADFNEDTLDEEIIRGAVITLAESSGLQMRRSKLGAAKICMEITYADGVRVEGQEKPKSCCILDRDILETAERIFRKAAVRRIRVRSIRLSLEGLIPLDYEVDLFEPEIEKHHKLQKTVDEIRNRFGNEKLLHGLAVVSVLQGKSSKRLLTAGTVNGF